MVNYDVTITVYAKENTEEHPLKKINTDEPKSNESKSQPDHYYSHGIGYWYDPD